MSGFRRRHDLTFQYPCSCRFPSRSEGNRARVRFPLHAGGTLRRGSSTAAFANSDSTIDSRSLNSA